MSETAEVVVVGGGVVGASIAHHLARRGCADVVVVERGAAAGAGSTGRAMGGARAQFAAELNIRLSLHSLDYFRRFPQETGYPSGYRPHGYLLFATEPRHMEHLLGLREMQAAAGLLDVEVLSPEEISRRVPLLNVDGVLGGVFRQADGFIDPLALTRGFTAAALSRGARFWMGTEVHGIDTLAGRVTGVRTSRGRIAARAIVNAAGPWAAEVARLAGSELPVRPLRRQIVGTRPFPGMSPEQPMVIDVTDGFHFRPDHAVGSTCGVRFAGPDPSERWGHDPVFEPAFVEAMLARARHRAPRLADAVVDPARCSAGLYAVSPDHHSILGEAEGVGGFFLANGFSGHGVMHSPATGVILSELILDGRNVTFPEADALGPARFRTGALLHEPSIF